MIAARCSASWPAASATSCPAAIATRSTSAPSRRGAARAPRRRRREQAPRVAQPTGPRDVVPSEHFTSSAPTAHGVHAGRQFDGRDHSNASSTSGPPPIRASPRPPGCATSSAVSPSRGVTTTLASAMAIDAGLTPYPACTVGGSRAPRGVAIRTRRRAGGRIPIETRRRTADRATSAHGRRWAAACGSRRRPSAPPARRQ